MMRLWPGLVMVVLSLWPLSLAVAGDQSTLNRLGFSGDGSIYAFEEFGRQDGSGFPYANRFYINTADDSFVSGTPIRVRLDDETATIDQARAQAAMQGQAAVMPDSALEPGFLAGFNAVTEASADAATMIVNPRPVEPPVDAPLLVRLEALEFLADETCEAVSPSAAGFRLLAVSLNAGASVHEIHADDRVPSSRGCPLGYRLGAIETFYPDNGPPVYAVLIAVRSFGFEGPDYRWMAVTSSLAP